MSSLPFVKLFMSDDIVIRTESVINTITLCTIYHCTSTHFLKGSFERKHITLLGLLTTYVLLPSIPEYPCQITLPSIGFAPSHPSSHTLSGLNHSSSSAYFTRLVNVSTGPIPLLFFVFRSEFTFNSVHLQSSCDTKQPRKNSTEM